MDKRPLLVTGFKPFGGQKVNASWLAVEAMASEIAGHTVEKRRLPCVFGQAGDAVRCHINEINPIAVICVGEHQGGASVALERVAINLASTTGKHPDTAGNAPCEKPLIASGSYGLPSTLEVASVAQRLQEAGVPVQLSCSAGLYVCNSVLYSALYEQQQRQSRGEQLPFVVCFVHVPVTPTQAATQGSCLQARWPSMETGLAAKALEIVAEMSVDQAQKAFKDLHL